MREYERRGKGFKSIGKYVEVYSPLHYQFTYVCGYQLKQKQKQIKEGKRELFIKSLNRENDDKP